MADVPPNTQVPFLYGVLLYIEGQLTLNAGAGSHLIMLSDEANTGNVTNTQLTNSSFVNFAQANIYYSTSSSFKRGITGKTVDIHNFD